MARKRRALNLTGNQSADQPVAISQVDAVEFRFDYSQVDAAHRERVQLATSDIKRRLKRTAQDIVETGRQFCEVKELLSHGQFTEWLEQEFEFTPRLARQWMAVAERFGDKTEKFSVLPHTALYLLAAPSTDESVVEEVGRRLEAGERVKVADVQELVQEWRQIDMEEMIATVQEEDAESVKYVDVNGAVALIWSSIKQACEPDNLRGQLDWLQAHHQIEHFRALLKAGTEMDDEIFERAYGRVRSELELGILGGKLIAQMTYKGSFPTKDVPPPPAPPPTSLALCEKDRLLALDGPFKEMKIDVVRQPDGAIGWLRVGGRIHRRED